MIGKSMRSGMIVVTVFGVATFGVVGVTKDINQALQQVLPRLTLPAGLIWSVVAPLGIVLSAVLISRIGGFIGGVRIPTGRRFGFFLD